jgi:hypothetical protein
VVLDIAACCRVQTDWPPTANNRKDLLKEWIDADDAMKIELHELIKLSKPKFRILHVDGILAEHGHVCLHLPLYHPELNATEKIWAIVKNWVAARNVILNYRTLKLAVEKFALVTREEWVSVCNHVKELEKKYLRTNMLDIIPGNFIINVGTSDSNADQEDKDADGSRISPLSSDSALMA